MLEKGFSINWISKTIDWMWQLFLLQLKYSYFCYNWNLWLSQTNSQIQLIEWFVQLIELRQLSYFENWFGYLKECALSFSVIKKKKLSKSIPWDFLREILLLLCDHHFGKAFQIKKPLRMWIFKASLKWGSCYFGSGPKLSLLHLIFILRNLFCVEVLCDLFWSCWSIICLLFSITGFVIELVQWVSALVSHLLRGSVEDEYCWEQCCLRTASVVVQWVSVLVTH